MQENETIKRLREARRKKRRKYIIALLTVVGILGVLSTYVLILFGLLLMLIGAESMADLGSQIVKLKYYRYMTSGFHELVEAENKGRNENIRVGIILVIIGFGIFFAALYLLSVGWNGFL